MMYRGLNSVPGSRRIVNRSLLHVPIVLQITELQAVLLVILGPQFEVHRGGMTKAHYPCLEETRWRCRPGTSITMPRPSATTRAMSCAVASICPR